MRRGYKAAGRPADPCLSVFCVGHSQLWQKALCGRTIRYKMKPDVQLSAIALSEFGQISILCFLLSITSFQFINVKRFEELLIIYIEE